MVFWINFFLNSNTQANRLTFSTSGGRGEFPRAKRIGKDIDTVQTYHRY